jgi:hypothetical protein
MEWEAFDSIDPIGEGRADFRMAVIASTIMNVAISAFSKKGKGKMTSPDDFMPKWDEAERKPKVQSTEQMFSILKGMATKKKRKRTKQPKKKE